MWIYHLLVQFQQLMHCNCICVTVIEAQPIFTYKKRGQC
ncbi:hypothetical protein ACHAWX_003145 [Stephanocyclus meneghinianus]